jgi:hypothetical protein
MGRIHELILGHLCLFNVKYNVWNAFCFNANTHTELLRTRKSSHKLESCT